MIHLIDNTPKRREKIKSFISSNFAILNIKDFAEINLTSVYNNEEFHIFFVHISNENFSEFVTKLKLITTPFIFIAYSGGTPDFEVDNERFFKINEVFNNGDESTPLNKINDLLMIDYTKDYLRDIQKIFSHDPHLATLLEPFATCDPFNLTDEQKNAIQPLNEYVDRLITKDTKE